MLRPNLTTIIRKFSQGIPSANPFESFLNHKQSELRTKRGTLRNVNNQDIHVSSTPLSRDSVTSFM